MELGKVILKWDYLEFLDIRKSSVWNFTFDTWKDLPPLGVSQRDLEIVFELEEKLNFHPFFFELGRLTPITNEYHVFAKVNIEGCKDESLNSLVMIIDNEVKGVNIFIDGVDKYHFVANELFKDLNRKPYRELCSKKRIKNHKKYFHIEVVESPVDIKTIKVPL